MPATWFVEVLLAMTLEEALRAVLPALATLQQAQNGVLLQCYVEDIAWAAKVLVGLGCPMIVRRPVEPRDELRRLAMSVLQAADAHEE